MQKAFEVARSALNVPETPVGCVYVYHDKIIANGFNETNLTLNGTRHSEFVGYDKIRKKYKNFREIFKETDLYVTVEPCIMCASLLRQMGIRAVYFGCANERFGGNGSVLHVNSDISPNCIKYHVIPERSYLAFPGILDREAIVLLREFYIKENKKSPKTIRKKHRRLDLDTFPHIDYKKYLTRDQFTNVVGEKYGFIFDNNEFIDFDPHGRILNTQHSIKKQRTT